MPLYKKCCYAECRQEPQIMIRAVMLNAIMLNVVAPTKPGLSFQEATKVAFT